jgi:hypothetical protein
MLALSEHPVLSRHVPSTTPTDLSPFSLANPKAGTQFAKLQTPISTGASIMEVHIFATAICFGATVQRKLGRFPCQKDFAGQFSRTVAGH